MTNDIKQLESMCEELLSLQREVCEQLLDQNGNPTEFGGLCGLERLNRIDPVLCEVLQSHIAVYKAAGHQLLGYVCAARTLYETHKKEAENVR